MKFRVGNKIKPTKELLRNLSKSLSGNIRDGGTIIGEKKYGYKIKFYSGKFYVLSTHQLILLPAKNEQLLFSFMTP